MDGTSVERKKKGKGEKKEKNIVSNRARTDEEKKERYGVRVRR